MTRSAYVPDPTVCECCGEVPEDGKLSHRYPPSGIRVGACCLKLKGAELAVAYGRRLRRIAEGRTR